MLCHYLTRKVRFKKQIQVSKYNANLITPQLYITMKWGHSNTKIQTSFIKRFKMFNYTKRFTRGYINIKVSKSSNIKTKSKTLQSKNNVGSI